MLIAGLLPESFVDWRGKLVATIFTYGCNMRCPFCHNYALVIQRQDRFLNPEDVLRRIEELREWIDGVCITGGEPTIHPDLPLFIRELSKITKVKLDTNGTNPDILRDSLPYLSYVAMDIKAPPHRYSELSGVQVNMRKIEESISLIRNKARDYEFRTTAVPLLNQEDFEEIASWLSGAKRYVIQQYSTQNGTLNPEFRNLSPHPEPFLREICKKIAHHFGECILANL